MSEWRSYLGDSKSPSLPLQPAPTEPIYRTSTIRHRYPDQVQQQSEEAITHPQMLPKLSHMDKSQQSIGQNQKSALIVENEEGPAREILLDDICLLRQSVDLIFNILTVINKLTEENQSSAAAICLHSTVLAGSLYLLGNCVPQNWTEVAIFLPILPKADRFFEAVFVAVHVDVELLQKILSVQEYLVKHEVLSGKYWILLLV
ncbi:hypothetical protein POM88_047336 [Heracleum sosnowskyi]|uniref:Nodulin homeobox N-terminal domain-containing protein n=1 Tax=Heracleum sosnowskyi TaxID=360622 RepID=A0AAD8GRY9_9APIA|nr:hypothetical protein POM88_047336 [Heracleum sosnowskyi]